MVKSFVLWKIRQIIESDGHWPLIVSQTQMFCFDEVISFLWGTWRALISTKLFKKWKVWRKHLPWKSGGPWKITSVFGTMCSTLSSAQSCSSKKLSPSLSFWEVSPWSWQALILETTTLSMLLLLFGLIGIFFYPCSVSVPSRTLFLEG